MEEKQNEYIRHQRHPRLLQRAVLHARKNPFFRIGQPDSGGGLYRQGKAEL